MIKQIMCGETTREMFHKVDFLYGLCNFERIYNFVFVLYSINNT